jgi:hypothetical protein
MRILRPPFENTEIPNTGYDERGAVAGGYVPAQHFGQFPAAKASRFLARGRFFQVAAAVAVAGSVLRNPQAVSSAPR